MAHAAAQGVPNSKECHMYCHLIPDSSTKNLLPAQAPCPFPLAASAQRSMATVLAAQIAALKQQLGMLIFILTCGSSIMIFIITCGHVRFRIPQCCSSVIRENL